MASSVSPSSSPSVPGLRVFQYNPQSLGSAEDTLNLFRGSLSLPVDLLVLPGGNGLDATLRVTGQSDVQAEILRWNLDAPTSVVGAGWSMPRDRIVRASAGASRLTEQLWFLSAGTAVPLLRTDASWQRGVLPAAAAELDAALARGTVTAGLAAALAPLGISVSDTARIARRADGAHLIDAGRGTTLRLAPRPGGDIAVLGGGEAYELRDYQFWQVQYHRELEVWEVVKDDGTRHVFGDLVEAGAPAAAAVEWGIDWAGWVGPSREPTGQARYAVAWNISHIENLFGDAVRFRYRPTEQRVGDGALSYTKASYLAEISTSLGVRATFHYLPKTYDESAPSAPKEYLDPHRTTGLDTPNAFQDRYETEYLDTIAVFTRAAAADELLFTLRFHYNAGRLVNLTEEDPQNPLAYGGTFKRYLTAIDRVYPTGAALPGYAFEYDWSTSPERNRGALTAVTYPSGARVTYAYTRTEVGGAGDDAVGSRTRTVANPFGTRGGAPRVWFAGEYVVNTWYSPGEQQLAIAIFDWLGRWSPWPGPDVFHVIDGANLELRTLQASAGARAFAISYLDLTARRTAVLLFHQHERELGRWSVERMPDVDSLSVAIDLGDDFVTVRDDAAQRLHRYAWDWQTERWIADVVDEATLCAGGPGDHLLFVAARGPLLATLCYRPPGTGEPSRLRLVHRDPLGAWRDDGQLDLGDLRLAEGAGGATIARLLVGETLAAFAFVTAFRARAGVVERFDYALRIFRWDARGAGLAEAWRGEFRDLPISLVEFIGAGIVDDTLVASGPQLVRYDGRAFHLHDMGIQVEPGRDPRATVYWYAYTGDAALATENGPFEVVGKLATFDPDAAPASSGGWQQQEVLAVSPGKDRLRRYFPTASGAFLSLDRAVYARGLRATFRTPLRDDLLGELPASVATTAVVNQGPGFLAALELAAAPPGPAATSAWLFENGGWRRHAGQPIVEQFAEQIFDIIDDAGFRRADLSGKLPGIASGFFSFPLGESLDQASAITLHRYAAESLRDPLVAYPVTEIAVDWGMGTTRTDVRYDDASAARDPSGTVVRFHRVTVYPGSIGQGPGGNGHQVSYFQNGLPAAVPGLLGRRVHATLREAHDARDAFNLDGFLLRREVYREGEATAFADTDLFWRVYDEVADPADPARVRKIRGAYVRLEATRSALDGVAKHEENTYDLATGQVATTVVDNYDSDGKEVWARRRYVYGASQYASLRSRNLLNTQIETREEASDDGRATWVLGAAQVTVYRDWPSAGPGGTVPAIAATYQARHAGVGAFSHWDAADPPPPEDWSRSSLITRRDLRGAVLEAIDVGGMVTATIYDARGLLPLAAFGGASPEVDGAGYHGFEAYEVDGGWRFAPAVPGAASPSGVTDVDAHTGQRCFEIGEPGALAREVTVPASPRQYLLSGWIRPSPGFSRRGGTLAVRAVAAAGGVVAARQLGPTELADGTWQKIELRADVASGGALVLAIEASWPAGEALFVRIDDLRFTPTDALFHATVYAMDRLRPTAQLNSNGQAGRLFYDTFDRVLGGTGPADLAVSLTVPFMRRQVPAGTSGAPRAAELVNQTTAFVGRAPGFLEEFKAGSLGPDGAWEVVSGAPDDWQVHGRELHFSGESGDPLGARVRRRGFAHASFVVSCRVQPTARASLGNGAVYVLWDPAAGWSLIEPAAPRRAAQGAQTSQLPFGEDWCLAIVDGRLLFSANGVPIFSAHDAAFAPAAASLELGLSAPGSVARVAVAVDPLVNMVFFDDTEQERQTLGLAAGDAAIVTGALRDPAGREAIVTKPVRVTSADRDDPFRYDPDLVTNAGMDSPLWLGAPMEGRVAAAYPADEGYPFGRRIYERSPLGRKVGASLAGKAFAWLPDDANPHVMRMAYGANTGREGLRGDLPAGQYHVQTSSDASGRTRISIFDKIGQPVGTVVGPLASAGARYLRSSRRIDPRGLVIAVYPPRYYELRDTDPAAAEAYVGHYRYDFLGQREWEREPDSGEASFYYDLAGQPRLLVDAQGIAEGFGIYHRYDRAGRIVEKGTVPLPPGGPDPALREHLRRRVLDPAWPTPEDDAAEWCSRLTYDGAGEEQIGRLTESRTRNETAGGELEVIERFAYDLAGRVRRAEIAWHGASIAEAAWIAYDYDLTGSLQRQLDGTMGLATLYRYDAMNLLVEIGDAGGAVYARYEYTAGGQLAREHVAPRPAALLTNEVTYETTGWPRKLESPAFVQALGYTSGGVDGAGYYDGSIATSDVRYPGLDQRRSVGYQLDGASRLTAFAGGDGPTVVDYDDNGNLRARSRAGGDEAFVLARGTNQLLRVTSSAGPGWTLEHDALGNVTKLVPPDRPALELAYVRASGATRQVTSSAGDTVELAYAADQRRVRKLVHRAGALVEDVRYVHGTALRPVLEIRTTAGSAAPVARCFVYGPTGLLAIRQGTELFYVIKDHQQSTRAVLDAAGGVVAAFDYGPFGDLRVLAGDARFTYLFTGQELDPELGLYHFGARLYASELGRFLSVDPANQPWSPYTYAFNNPVGMIDPDGQLPWLVFGALALLTAAGSFAYSFSRADSWQEALWKGAVLTGAGVVLLPFGGGGVLSTVGIAVLEGAIYGAVSGLLFEDPSDWRAILKEAGFGALGGLVTGGLLPLGYQVLRNGLRFGIWRHNEGLIAFHQRRLLASANDAADAFDAAPTETAAVNAVATHRIQGEVQAAASQISEIYRLPPGRPAWTQSFEISGTGADGVTDLITGQTIFYGKTPFETVDAFKSTLIHEWGHYRFDRDLVGGNWQWRGVPNRSNYNDGAIAYSTEIRYSGLIHLNTREFSRRIAVPDIGAGPKNPIWNRTWWYNWVFALPRRNFAL